MFRTLAVIALLPAVAHGQYVYNPYYRVNRWGTVTQAVQPYTAFYGQPAAAAPSLAPTTCTTCTQQVCQYVPHTTYRVAYRQVPVTTYQNFTTVDPCTGCPRVCMRPVTTCVRQSYYVPCTTYHRVCRQVTLPTTCQTASTVAVAPAPTCSSCTPGAMAPAVIPQAPATGLPAPSLIGPPIQPAPASPAPASPAPATAPMTGAAQPSGAFFAPPGAAPNIAQPKEASVAQPPPVLKPIAPALGGGKKQPEAPPLLDPRQRTASTADGWHYTSATGPALDDSGWVAK
jgi:hypothetical protein